MRGKVFRYLTVVFVLAIVFIMILSGCANRSVKKGYEKRVNTVVSNGVGKDRKFASAKDKAIRDALKKVVVNIIGEENEKKNRKKLDEYMYSISESFVVSYDITDKVKTKEGTVVYMRVVFDKDRIIDSIKTLEIEIPAKKEKKNYSKSPYAPIIKEAIDNLTYLVYFEPKDKNISDEYARLCVNRVNNYLASKGYEYVDLDRINEIKDEYIKLYKATQGSVSVVQLIAQALNADIYIVVDGKVEYLGKEGGIYFASASIDLKAYESATGRGLGTETGYSGKLGLPSGKDAAMRKCVEVAVEKAIKPVIELSRQYMMKAFEKGIRYEVVVQGIDNYKLLREFVDAIRNTKNFRSLKEVSAAPGQAKYYVYYMGRKNELINEIMDNIQNEEGFENLEVLVSRGNAVIFGIRE